MSDSRAADEIDDTTGHRFTDVGEVPVEGGRRPTAIGDEDDVQGHARTARAHASRKATPHQDDAADDATDDVEGHARSARVKARKATPHQDDATDDVEGHAQSARVNASRANASRKNSPHLAGDEDDVQGHRLR